MCGQDANATSLFYIFSLVKIALPIFLLLLCVALRCLIRLVYWLRRLCRSTPPPPHEALADRLEMIETVVFQMQLISSWRS